jgi:hypothetical protein
VRVTASSEPGSPDAPNEDAFFISPDSDTVAIFDGATARTGTGCTHGVAWYTHSLVGSLAGHTRLTPAKALAAAIADTAARHRHTCDLAHPGTPSAAVAIAQARRKTLRYLLLGDVTLVLGLDYGIRVLTDSRVHGTARAERQAADNLPSGSSEKAQALVRMKQAELTARNVAGGYWVAAADSATLPGRQGGTYPGSSSRLRFCCRHTRMIDRRLRPVELAASPCSIAGQTPNGDCRTSGHPKSPQCAGRPWLPRRDSGGRGAHDPGEDCGHEQERRTRHTDEPSDPDTGDGRASSAELGDRRYR